MYYARVFRLHFEEFTEIALYRGASSTVTAWRWNPVAVRPGELEAASRRYPAAFQEVLGETAEEVALAPHTTTT